MPRIVSIFGFVAAISLSAIWPSFAQSSAPEPRGKPISSFGLADRDILTAEFAKLWPGCSDPNISCDEMRVSVFPLGQNANLLAMMIPSDGSCGDNQFAILGPLNKNGKRQPLGGETLLPACGEDIKFEPAAKTGARPAVVFISLDRVTSSGNEYYDDERWEWTGKDLVFVKSLHR